MKIRVGFVSNSSSSSCFFYGRSLAWKEVEALVKEGLRVVGVNEGGGRSGDVEDFIFDLSLDCLQFLKKAKNLHERFRFFLVDKELTEDDEESFSLQEDLTGGELFYFRRDYSSPHGKERSLEGLKDWYEWRGKW